MNTMFSDTVYRIAGILDAKNADDILLLHVGEKTIVADYFIICSGRAANHVKVLSEELEEKLAKEEGILPARIEGLDEGRWVVMDYGDILVHIFHKDEREFYNIERLWMTEGNSEKYSPENSGV